MLLNFDFVSLDVLVCAMACKLQLYRHGIQWQDSALMGCSEWRVREDFHWSQKYGSMLGNVARWSVHGIWWWGWCNNDVGSGNWSMRLPLSWPQLLHLVTCFQVRAYVPHIFPFSSYVVYPSRKWTFLLSNTLKYRYLSFQLWRFASGIWFCRLYCENMGRGHQLKGAQEWREVCLLELNQKNISTLDYFS